MSLERKRANPVSPRGFEERRDDRRVVDLQSRRVRAMQRAKEPSREHPNRLLAGDRFVIRRGRRLVLVPLDEVLFAAAEGNYVRLHLEHESHLLRVTMSALDDQLSDRGFLRIHRSTLVRIDEIAEIRTTPAGDHEVVLHTGVKKRWSRGYRDRLEAFLAS